MSHKGFKKTLRVTDAGDLKNPCSSPGQGIYKTPAEDSSSTGNTTASTPPPHAPPQTFTKEADVYKLFTNKQIRDQLLRETAVFAFRVSLYHKILYNTKISSSREKRRVLRSIIEKAIESLSELDGIPVGEGPVVVNMPVNVNINHVEAKAEAWASVNIDVDAIVSELERLRRLIANWMRLGKIPAAAYDTAAEIIKRVEKKLNEVN